MSSYSIQDIERLAGISRSLIQGFVDSGFVDPVRGAHDELVFSFQDLIVLRAAQGLAAVKIPSKRIKQSLARLREQLPPTLPMSGIRISALGTRIVVHQGAAQWQADPGQYLLDFDVAPAQGQVAFLEKDVAASDDAERWFERGRELEDKEPAAAEDAYRTAI